MGKHLAVETQQDALAEAAEFASDARQRAELFNFLAALLNARPDENLVFRLRAIQPGEFFDRLAGDGRDGCVAEGLQAIAEWVYATAGRDVEVVNTQLAVDWTRLFRGLRPGYGPTPPYESLYTGDGKGTRVIGEVMNAYRRNGAALEESIHNQADYLGLELGYLGFLAGKEAQAWKSGEEVLAAYYYQAAADFLNAHPGRWTVQFCDAAAAEAKTGFYRGVTLLIKGVIEELAHARE